MDASHHIPAEMLAAYAAGSLSEAFSLVVACHVSLCDTCRADVTSFEAVGGAVLETGEVAATGPGALEATLALIKSAPEPALKAKPCPIASVFPAPLQDYVGASPSDVRWRSIGGGVKQSVLDCGGEAKARLLYIPGGKAVPEHSHKGIELTLVLQGSFADSVSRFERGDVEVGDSDLEHQPIADHGLDCICLAATDAPLRFRALVPRLFQPFIGI
jgi:putative transcriptional regulator